MSWRARFADSTLGEGVNIKTIKWLVKGIPSVWFFMFPGIVAGIIVAVFFASGQAGWISAIAVCALITYAIMQSSQIRDLKEQINERATLRELDGVADGAASDIEDTNTTIEALNDKVNYITKAISDQMDALNVSMTDEYREMYLMIADHKFGPADDDGEAGV